MSRLLENQATIKGAKHLTDIEMPTKHIDDATWRKVEKETVKAVVQLQASVKDTEVLRWLILKGLEEITPDDYQRFHKKKD
ncbi:hypothetical protein D9M70_520320 [compost metagenome]